MWVYLAALIFGLCLVSLVVFYARKSAKESARLNAIKEEAKERQRAQSIMDTVARTDIDRVRDKLQQTK